MQLGTVLEPPRGKGTIAQAQNQVVLCTARIGPCGMRTEVWMWTNCRIQTPPPSPGWTASWTTLHLPNLCACAEKVVCLQAWGVCDTMSWRMSWCYPATGSCLPNYTTSSILTSAINVLGGLRQMTSSSSQLHYRVNHLRMLSRWLHFLCSILKMLYRCSIFLFLDHNPLYQIGDDSFSQKVHSCFLFHCLK